PIIQLSLSSKTLSESDVYDFALWRVRQQLSVIQGQTIPSPYGGKERQIQVDIDPELLQSRGISPLEVSQAVNANNLAFPTGSARIDTQEYPGAMDNKALT